MSDMMATVVPKSDQMSADDLLTGPRTITITRVVVDGSMEQPVSIFYEGDDGRPYKACKSMRRILIRAWGPDASKYPSQSMTLYCDPTVKFGGMAVGGIRISAMTGINEPFTMALTATKAKKALFTVKPLHLTPPEPVTIDNAKSTKAFLDALEAALSAAEDPAAILAHPRIEKARGTLQGDYAARLEALIDGATPTKDPE